jgi:hypothetical protein
MITPGTYVNDIRMGSLTVPYLLQGGITVLYVHGTKDGASPCQYSYRTFVSGLIPSKAAKLLTYSIITYGSSLIGLASSVLFGSNAILAYFNPPNAASRFVPPNSNQDEITVGVATIAQLLGIPAPITIIPVPQFTAIDATFSILDMETVPTYPESVYETVVNQPLISNQGEYNCLNYKYLFDTDTTDAFVTGTLTTYAPFLPKTSTMLDTFLFTFVWPSVRYQVFDFSERTGVFGQSAGSQLQSVGRTNVVRGYCGYAIIDHVSFDVRVGNSPKGFLTNGYRG